MLRSLRSAEETLKVSEDLEEVEVDVTLSEPARMKLGGCMREEVVFGEDLGEDSVAMDGARVVLVRLKEEEAVLRAKPGRSAEEVEVLCNGVAGALTLPPPSPP